MRTDLHQKIWFFNIATPTIGSEHSVHQPERSPISLVEYNVSYVYHALFANFDRDKVALKGLARFFKETSLEEREHAEKLMEYQVFD
ncbi:hypothetical protein QYF36_013348 [Acer negundo]|nr:hypothetical protein QYF36_013348 [Acer negundo]